MPAGADAVRKRELDERRAIAAERRQLEVDRAARERREKRRKRELEREEEGPLRQRANPLAPATGGASYRPSTSSRYGSVARGGG